jgi:helicase required for RNAi-mediated heterochromatin assembly 1
MELNAHLPERFRGRQRQDLRKPTNTQQSDLDLSLNIDIRQYVQAQDAISGSTKSDAWLSLTEMPTNSEIGDTGDEDVALAANKIKGKWKSKEKYLRAHYELLREDAVSPLREAVDTFRQDPDMMDSQSVSIYEKARPVAFRKKL